MFTVFNPYEIDSPKRMYHSSLRMSLLVYIRIICIHAARNVYYIAIAIYVSSFAKSCLVHTQFQCSVSPPLDGYSNGLPVYVCTISLNLNSLLLLSSLLTSTSARIVYKWPHLAWTSRQQTGNHHMTG